MIVPQFLQSFDAYKEAFVRCLVRLGYLYNDPASRITVAAVSGYHGGWKIFDDEDVTRMIQRSYHDFTKFCELDPTIRLSENDQTMFDKLCLPGGLKFVEPFERKVGDFSAVHIPIRNYRATGAATDKMLTRLAEFDPVKDALFTQEFLIKERFWRGRIGGVETDLFLCRPPNLLGHSVWVPWPEKRLYQEMTEELHDWVWEVTAAAGAGIPRFAMGFNSIGGGATQKQFHLHSTLENPWSVTKEVWRHNSGRKDYPATVLVSGDKREAWRSIRKCLDVSYIAYDLLYEPGKLYVIPGKLQSECIIPDWATGVGVGDKAGRIITSCQEGYDSVTEAMISETLEQWSVKI